MMARYDGGVCRVVVVIITFPDAVTSAHAICSSSHFRSLLSGGRFDVSRLAKYPVREHDLFCSRWRCVSVQPIVVLSNVATALRPCISTERVWYVQGSVLVAEDLKAACKATLFSYSSRMSRQM